MRPFEITNIPFTGIVADWNSVCPASEHFNVPQTYTDCSVYGLSGGYEGVDNSYSAGYSQSDLQDKYNNEKHEFYCIYPLMKS